MTENEIKDICLHFFKFCEKTTKVNHVVTIDIIRDKIIEWWRTGSQNVGDLDIPRKIIHESAIETGFYIKDNIINISTTLSVPFIKKEKLKDFKNLSDYFFFWKQEKEKMLAVHSFFLWKIARKSPSYKKNLYGPGWSVVGQIEDIIVPNHMHLISFNRKEDGYSSDIVLTKDINTRVIRFVEYQKSKTSSLGVNTSCETKFTILTNEYAEFLELLISKFEDIQFLCEAKILEEM